MPKAWEGAEGGNAFLTLTKNPCNDFAHFEDTVIDELKTIHQEQVRGHEVSSNLNVRDIYFPDLWAKHRLTLH